MSSQNKRELLCNQHQWQRKRQDIFFAHMFLLLEFYFFSKHAFLAICNAMHFKSAYLDFATEACDIQWIYKHKVTQTDPKSRLINEKIVLLNYLYCTYCKNDCCGLYSLSLSVPATLLMSSPFFMFLGTWPPTPTPIPAPNAPKVTSEVARMKEEDAFWPQAMSVYQYM